MKHHLHVYIELMNNVLMFYDSRCNLVIEKSGYAIDPFQIVANGNELKEKMEMLMVDLLQKNIKNG